MSPSLPTSSKVFILQNPPTTDVKPDTFSLETRDIPEVKDGEILVKTVYLSNDPAQRGWMQKDIKASRLYVPPVRQGDIMRSFGIGKVLASKSDKYKEGDLVVGPVNWQEYAVLLAASVNAAQPFDGLNPSVYLGTLGLTGLTAWFGLHKVGNITKDDTVVISGAAGATGGAAVQIAKNVVGCKKVVGIAGGAAKCEYVKKLGADACVDYKSPTFEKDLTEALGGEDGLADVYYDNVGGSILDLMFTKIRQGGTVIACGAIATYNDPSKSTFPNYFDVIAMRLKIQGMIVLDWMNEAPQTVGKLIEAVKAKKITVEGGETIVPARFDEIPKTWLKLFEGGNQGKLVTHLV